LQERADWVTRNARGAGVSELVEALIESDLAELAPRLGRHDIALDAPREQKEQAQVRLHPYGSRVLLCGTSGSGKSTLATSFMEGLFDACYQVCLIDPEGDFEELEPAISLGSE